MKPPTRVDSPAAATLAVSCPLMIETGQQAPDFNLPDQDGDEVTLSSRRGKPVVLYFYPKVDTRGF